MIIYIYIYICVYTYIMYYIYIYIERERERETYIYNQPIARNTTPCHATAWFDAAQYNALQCDMVYSNIYMGSLLYVHQLYFQA